MFTGNPDLGKTMGFVHTNIIIFLMVQYLVSFSCLELLQTCFGESIKEINNCLCYYCCISQLALFTNFGR